MPDNFDATKMKLGPCVVSYKGNALGATDGGVKIDMNLETVDIKCDQSYGQPVKRVVTAVKLNISMSMLEIDKAMALFLDGDGKITKAKIGSDLLTGGGILLLTPVDTTDKVSYNFPLAVLDPQSGLNGFSATGADKVELKFEARADASGTFLEKITAA